MPPISLNYIKSALQRGETKEQIKSSLRLQGISEQEIDTAFNSIGSESSKSPENPNKDFLASNINPVSQPSAPVPVSSPPPPPSSQPSPMTENRMQYNAPQSSKSWFWPVLIVVFLIVLGASVAGYYYFDEVKGFAVSKYNSIFGSVEIEEPTPSPTSTPSPTPTPITPETPETPEAPVLSGDELKLDQMDKLELSLEQYFTQNGSYPAILEIEDPDGFYCYRKNGAHYVLGTTLEGQEQVLDNDLDGSYLCGKTVKECADPVYCVEP